MLSIVYANGDEQEIDLKGEVNYPLLAVSPAEHHFGAVHTDDSQKIKIYLSNPTYVDAMWTLVHVPSLLSPKKRGFSDEPEVFDFDTISGMLKGPTLPLDTAGLHQVQSLPLSLLSSPLLLQLIL